MKRLLVILGAFLAGYLARGPAPEPPKPRTPKRNLLAARSVEQVEELEASRRKLNASLDELEAQLARAERERRRLVAELRKPRPEVIRYVAQPAQPLNAVWADGSTFIVNGDAGRTLQADFDRDGSIDVYYVTFATSGTVTLDITPFDPNAPKDD